MPAPAGRTAHEITVSATSGTASLTRITDSRETPPLMPTYPKGNRSTCNRTPNKKTQPDSAAPEDQPGEPGAEGGSQSDAKDKLPGAPSDDDSPVGDTDQHSNA